MKLIKLEWMKFKGHPFFLIGTGLYIVCMFLLIFGAGEMELFGDRKSKDGSASIVPLMSLGEMGFYKLPYIWQNITYLASWFKFIPAFILIFFVANEYKFRTYRQNLIDGLNIRQFYISKMFSTLTFSIISLLIIGITGLVTAVFNNTDAGFSDFLTNSEYLIAFFAEVLFLTMFAVFLTFLFKSSTVAIIVLILYYFLGEPAAGHFVFGDFSDYLPTRPSRELITEPFTRMFKVDSFLGIESPDTVSPKFLSLTFIYTLIFAVGGYFILKRRDA